MGFLHTRHGPKAEMVKLDSYMKRNLGAKHGRLNITAEN